MFYVYNIFFLETRNVKNGISIISFMNKFSFINRMHSVKSCLSFFILIWNWLLGKWLMTVENISHFKNHFKIINIYLLSTCNEDHQIETFQYDITFPMLVLLFFRSSFKWFVNKSDLNVQMICSDQNFPFVESRIPLWVKLSFIFGSWF